jgi:uncharacterized protein YjiS (DUF1127 family)
MPSPYPRSFVLLPQSPATSLPGQIWRVILAAVRTLRAGRAAAGHDAREVRALSDLDERMLKDIGASEWHAANAAMRSYDDLRTRIDGGLR